MKKIYKIANIALIFTLAGMVFLISPAYSLRVPHSFQDPGFPEKFTTIYEKGIKYFYYGEGTSVYTDFLAVYTDPLTDSTWSPRILPLEGIQKNIELILSIESIKANLKDGAFIFNLGSGGHPLLSFGNYYLKNFDALFPKKFSPLEKAVETNANFEKKEITEIEETCSVAIWYDLAHYIRGYAHRTSIWKDTKGAEEARKDQVLRRSLEYTWEIVEDGGYFIIAGIYYDRSGEVYKVVTGLGFNISEVHVIGEDIKRAKAIVLRKQSQSDQTLASDGQLTVVEMVKALREATDLTQGELEEAIKSIKEALAGLTLGGRIKALREMKGLSQKKLARKIKVSGSIVISHWERDMSVPEPKNRLPLARALDTDVVLLFLGKSLEQGLAGLTLPERIRTLREIRGLTQSQLARKAGFSKDAVFLWENGERKPRPKYILGLANALNVDAAVIVPGQSLSGLTMGKRLRALRKMRGLTQTELAKKIGVSSRRVISKWEQDKSSLTVHPKYILLLARALEVDGALIVLGKFLEEGLVGLALGEKIRALREIRGLTQAELAEKMHVSQTLISKWERGKKRPSKKYRPLLAKALRVDTEKLKNKKMGHYRQIEDLVFKPFPMTGL